MEKAFAHRILQRVPKLGRSSTLVILLAALTIGCGRPAAGDSLPAAAVDQLFAEWSGPDTPGCAVGVMQRGRLVFERGYGMADLDRKAAITPATLFDPASIAKPFTALSVMLLAEAGKLSLEDEVWTHVPEWVNRHDRITLRHLLAHTAGLRDAFLLIELEPPAPPDTDINARILQTLARQRGVNFTPGTEFAYNNGGYNLLASIVARVSGQPYREFAAAHILQPLGMTHSSFRGGPIAITTNHARGYHRGDRGFQLAREGGIDTSAIVGNSGMFTTVGDLLRWAQNFADARVGTPAHLAEMQTAVDLGSNGLSPWGLGLEVGEDRGLKTIGHGGGDRGIAAYLVRYPSHDVAAAVLCNLDNLNARVGQLARQVAAVYLPEGQRPASPATQTARSPVALAPDQLAGYTGLYRDVSTGLYGRIYLRGGKLWASMDAGDGAGDSVELVPLDANRFAIPGAPVIVEFLPSTEGHPQRLQVTGATPKPLISERVVEGFTPSSSQLREYAGRYASADLDVTYTIAAQPSGLAIQIPGRPDIPLQPVLPDAFHGSLVDLIHFARDGARGVTAFTIDRATVRNLRFERVRSGDVEAR
jgi:CubicO group peptidase (beta-lactamase class C family)